MADAAAQIEFSRIQLVASLTTVAESLRNAAAMADQFASIVRNQPTSLNLPTMQYPQALAQSSNQPQQAQPQQVSKRKTAVAHDEDGVIIKKTRRVMPPKDPYAPKRPASSYIMFQNDIRKDLKKKFPDITNAELMAMISKQWSEMAEDQKEVYNNAQAVAKQRYAVEKAAYDASHTAAVPPPSKSAQVDNTATVKKSPEAPVKPLSETAKEPIDAPTKPTPTETRPRFRKYVYRESSSELQDEDEESTRQVASAAEPTDSPSSNESLSVVRKRIPSGRVARQHKQMPPAKERRAR